MDVNIYIDVYIIIVWFLNLQCSIVLSFLVVLEELFLSLKLLCSVLSVVYQLLYFKYAKDRHMVLVQKYLLKSFLLI